MAVAEGRIDVANVNQHVVQRRPAKAKAAKKALAPTPAPEPEKKDEEVAEVVETKVAEAPKSKDKKTEGS